MGNRRSTALRAMLKATVVATLFADSAAPAIETEDRIDAAWQAPGLSERQAAAHLLRRFTFGPRPGDVDRVIAIGLGNWVEGQLLGDLPGAVVASRLGQIEVLSLSAASSPCASSPTVRAEG